MSSLDNNISESSTESNCFAIDIEQSYVSTVTSVVVNITLPTVTQANLLENLIAPLYGIIFLLSVVGNSLVLITLAKNKRMRTVTNVYLLNLALSDLLLGVFCIPFTLLGQMLKNFVFGIIMCKLIMYCQAVSVSVAVWTLVAISLERYFAICKPLKSRRWQTQFHAYKMIVLVWIASLTWSMPILRVAQLQSISGGRHKCREVWSGVVSERAYNLFLDGTLLLIPLIVMSLAYSLIAAKLWRGLRQELRQTSTCLQRQQRTESSRRTRNSTYDKSDQSAAGNACARSPRLRQGISHRHLKGSTQGVSSMICLRPTRVLRKHTEKCQDSNFSDESEVQVRNNGNSCQSRDLKDAPNEEQRDLNCPFSRQHVVRSNNMYKSIESKKKVIIMLFVIVLEFFVCWAPLYVVHTWYVFAPELVYSIIGSTGFSLVHLLAYISSCCNPITYCFMNRKFRQAFLSLFDCHRCWRVGCRNSEVAVVSTRNKTQVGNNSELSRNESTANLGKTSVVTRSEVVRLLEEDRV